MLDIALTDRVVDLMDARALQRFASSDRLIARENPDSVWNSSPSPTLTAQLGLTSGSLERRVVLGGALASANRSFQPKGWQLRKQSEDSPINFVFHRRTPPPMNEIALLLCGDNSQGTAKVALDQLSSSIQRFSSKAAILLAGRMTDETLSFGPFCARVLLENGCAALVGRLDSFRMLYLSEFQAQPAYEPGKRAKSAFAWSGDVMAEEKPNQALWSVDHDIPKISRALLSKHFEHIFWKPALNRMLDFASTLESDPLLSDVVGIDPDNFIDETKGKGAQLYSTLSKGVHWEFFTSAMLFDEATIKNSIRETFLLVAHLGLVSHFVHTAYASLEPADAISHYKAFRRLVP